MSSVEVTPKPETTPESAPELHLLMPASTFEEPLWKSLFRNLDEFFFPKKLPPLVLTSKPIPVNDIWGFYNYKKNGVWGSTIAHIVLIAAIIGITILGRRMVKQMEAPKATVELIDPTDIVLKSSKNVSGGGGGGGDRDKLQATKGKLPKFSMEQITPPAVVVRNEQPKLAVDPTVVVPPQIKISSNMPNLGNPTSMPSMVPSNGTGAGGGIGSGSGGGVGVGSGPGVGKGRGGGIGDGIFRVGGGVSAPKAIFDPDPDYSEEARKAKYQGTSVVSMIVGPDGRPRDIKVTRTLGLGLDEKVVEKLSTWRFEPAVKDGKPVAVEISVEVEFRLY